MRLSRIIGLQKPIMRQIHWCLKTEKENPIYFLKWCRINCFSECKRLFFIYFYFFKCDDFCSPICCSLSEVSRGRFGKTHIFLLKIGIGEKWAVGLTQESKEGAPLLQAWWEGVTEQWWSLPHPAMMEGIFWGHSSLLLPILQGYRRRRKKNRRMEE